MYRIRMIYFCLKLKIIFIESIADIKNSINFAHSFNNKDEINISRK